MKKIRVELHKYQMQVMQSMKRFILMVAGTQGGKTTTGAYWIFKEIDNYPQDEYLIAAPTYKIMGQSTLPRFLDVMRGMIPGKWNEQKKEFKIRAGGKVYFRSTEDPDAIEAMKCRAIWLDEAGKMKHRVWNAVNSRIAILKGKVLMTTSWYNLGWLYHDIYRRVDDDYEIIQFASNENPWFPEDEWDRLKKTLPEAEFRRRFGGEPIKAEGLVYSCFDRHTHVYDVEHTELPKGLFKFIGMDLGYTSPTAVLFCGIDKDGTIWVYDEYYERKGLLSYHAEQLKNRGYNRNIKIWADRSAAQEIAELSSAGLLIAGARNIDVNVGISKVSKLFISGKIKISSKCENLIDELETYSWRSTDDIEIKEDKVIKKQDHCVDALRYGITSTSFMLPEMRMPELNLKPTIIVDPVTGYPQGFEQDEDPFLWQIGYGRGLKMSDGRRLNLITGKYESNRS